MKTALQFSGGRDSLATLFLLEPFWDGMTVVWCDSGDSAPELHALMARVSSLVPHFATVEGCAPATRQLRGDPKPDAWIDCCTASIWIPMVEWVFDNDVRYLVRGTRKVDPVAWPLPNSQHGGITFVLPLWEWNEERLAAMLAHVAARGFAPVYPHDCLHCPVERVCDRPQLRNVA